MRNWEAADRDPTLVDDGALNVVIVGGGATGVETRRRHGRALPKQLRQGLPGPAAGEGADHARRGLPELFSMFKENLRDLDEARPREARRRVLLGEIVDSIDAHARDAQVGQGARSAHARLGRRAPGEPDRRVARARAARGQSCRPRSQISASPATPRCSPSATSRGSPTRRPTRSCRSSAPSRSRQASTPGRTSRGASPARRPSRSSTRTRARWRRSAAAQR